MLLGQDYLLPQRTLTDEYAKRWNSDYQGNLEEIQEKTPPKCHFIHHESHMNLRLGVQKAESDTLSCGYRKFSSTVDYLNILKAKLSFISGR